MSSREVLLREWWEQLRRQVDEVVEDVDPEGLLALDVPSGEYTSESDALTSLVVRGEISEAAVLAVWERAFGPGSGLSRNPGSLTSLTGRLLDLQTAHPRP